MSSGNISVNFGKLNDASTDMGAKRAKFQNLYSNLESNVTTVTNSNWEGDVGTAFVKKFNEYTKAFEGVNEFLMKSSEYIEQYSSEMQRLQSDMAGRIGG